MKIIQITAEDIINKSLEKSNEFESINLDNLVFVRTQDNIPNGISLTPKGYEHIFEEISPHVLAFSSIFGEWNIPYKDQKTPMYESARSTLHFCINGLVSNHMLGNFSNRSFYIFDKVNYLVENNNFISLNPQDSYARGEINLSNNSCICMSNTTYNNLSVEELKLINQYENIYLYDESIFNTLVLDTDIDYNQYLIEHYIISYVLNSMNCPCFLIGQHGFLNYDNEQEIQVNSIIDDLVIKHNLNREKHFYSKVREEDEKLAYERQQESIKNFYIYLIERSYEIEAVKKEAIEIISNHQYISSTIEQLLTKIVRDLGLEEYNQIVDNYNETLKINSRKR